MAIKTTPVENEVLLSFDYYPEEWHDKLAAYSFTTAHRDDFFTPYKYFYKNAFGDSIFFKTNSRKKALEMLKELEGEGKYSLRTVIRAKVC